MEAKATESFIEDYRSKPEQKHDTFETPAFACGSATRMATCKSCQIIQGSRMAGVKWAGIAPMQDGRSKIYLQTCCHLSTTLICISHTGKRTLQGEIDSSAKTANQLKDIGCPGPIGYNAPRARIVKVIIFV